MGGAQALSEPKDGWKFRRRLMIVSVAFCLLAIITLGVFGDPNNGIHTSLVSQFMMLLGTVFALYTGAPVVDDHFKKKNEILDTAPRGSIVVGAGVPRAAVG